MFRLIAVLIPAALWFSSAAADSPRVLAPSDGVLTDVSGAVSGSETSRYNLAVARGKAVRIDISSDEISSCSLGIVEPPSLMPFFKASGSKSTYRNVEINDRTLQVVAYPSRDAFISKAQCRFTISYQVN